ncbi:MAG: hypothetical protein PHD43_21725, partial [Methylococcales bacterium]|nr:hypothetical protein [Methylococcales bacterium]
LFKKSLLASLFERGELNTYLPVSGKNLSNQTNPRNKLTEHAMSNTDKNRSRLITLLKELFQLDQPELDFGLYKIMHAKSVQITKFLESDLLKEIEQAFGQVDDNRAAEAKVNYEQAIEQAKKFGAPNPEETEGVKEAKSAYENAKDSGNAES